jgi:hypothetical protein
VTGKNGRSKKNKIIDDNKKSIIIPPPFPSLLKSHRTDLATPFDLSSIGKDACGGDVVATTDLRS